MQFVRIFPYPCIAGVSEESLWQEYKLIIRMLGYTQQHDASCTVIQFVVPITTLLVPKFFKFCLKSVFGGSGDKTIDMINGTRRNGWYLAHLHLLVVVLLIYPSELLSIAYWFSHWGGYLTFSS